MFRAITELRHWSFCLSVYLSFCLFSFRLWQKLVPILLVKIHSMWKGNCLSLSLVNVSPISVRVNSFVIQVFTSTCDQTQISSLYLSFYLSLFLFFYIFLYPFLLTIFVRIILLRTFFYVLFSVFILLS